MNEAKHTPGPWVLDPPEDAHIAHGDYHSIKSGDGYLSERDSKGFGLAGFMSQHDAILIAAAPELLEALHSAKARINDLLANDDGQAWKEARKALPKIDAAIAKATGVN